MSATRGRRFAGLFVLAGDIFMLGGCAYTTVEVAYTDPGGKDVRIAYTSTKDISVDLVRDAEGKVQQLHVGGGASSVIAAQGEFTQSLGAAIGAGVATGLKTAAAR